MANFYINGLKYSDNEDRVRKDLDRLHKLASQTVLKSEQTDVSEISMATGFHIRKSQEEHFNEAIKKADNNMYVAKKEMKVYNKSKQH